MFSTIREAIILAIEQRDLNFLKLLWRNAYPQSRRQMIIQWLTQFDDGDERNFTDVYRFLYEGASPVLTTREALIYQSLMHFDLYHNTILNDQQQTLYHIAAKEGVMRVLELFMSDRSTKFTAMLNRQDIRGDTPFHLALRFDQYEFAVALMQNHVDLNIPNDQGVPAYNALDSCGMPFSFFAIKRNFKDWLDLCYNVCPESIHALDHEESNALHFALRNDQTMVAISLMKMGIALTQKNKFGVAALEQKGSQSQLPLAIQAVTNDCLDVFLDALPRDQSRTLILSQADKNGNRIIQYLWKEGKTEYIKKLLTMDTSFKITVVHNWREWSRDMHKIMR